MRSTIGKQALPVMAVGLAAICGMATWSGAVEPRRGPVGPRELEEPMSATGVVREFARNPHGDVDGLILENGTEVKVPPHQGNELRDLVRTGDKVRVEGRRHVTREGDVHLHADRIIDSAGDKTWERDEPVDRSPPPHMAPPRREAVADRAPPPGPLNDEILQELRAIRRLLENQK